ncbi:MAG: NYN domain-containing protein [Ruminococcus sp.]
MKQLAVGILAHVDSGKTTLSEAMLFYGGEIRKLGRVDHGDAFLDTHSLEKQRGITIFSKQAVLTLHDTEITILDTPGHVDFSPEMERTLQVLDAAILVISASDGVQSHTETLWRLLAGYNVPVFVFVNKMDISDRPKEDILTELKERLSPACTDFTAEKDDDFYEQTALCDEMLLDSFLENGKLSQAEISSAVMERRIFPCYFGSARKTEGVDKLLEGLEIYAEKEPAGDKFGARVFKIATDDRGERLTFMKITGGSLKVRSQIEIKLPDGSVSAEKVTQLRIYSGSKYKTIDEAEAGCVCAALGLNMTQCGMGLGFEGQSRKPVLQPVMTYRLVLSEGTDPAKALLTLRRLEEESPELHLVWNERLSEIHAEIMGAVQLEILSKIIDERFGMKVSFDKGSIAYKETIAEPVEGVGHYEPLRHYAEVHVLMEPLPRNSGLEFCTDCSEDILDKNWQRLILTHLQEKTHAGVLTGSPVTDMRFTLVSGRAHQKHTEGGDFRQATYRAVRQGLSMAKSVLLEPWYAFRIEVPQTQIGRAMNDLQRMEAEFSVSETERGMSVLTGRCSAAQMQDYAQEITAYTQGKGRISCIPDGYDECRKPESIIESIGYSAESDMENPADSVFCSHGAGFLVKWDKVPEYMHIPYRKEKQGDMQEDILQAETKSLSRSSYGGSLQEDKELMAIFERTYGKIDRDERSAMHTRRDETLSDTPIAPQKPLHEYILVDGYNIIFAWDELKKIAADNLEAARHRLIEMMINYKAMRKCDMIIVFDAYRVKGNPGSEELKGGLHVVYTKEAETADSYIERTAHDLSGEYRVRVATSDRLEQIIILGGGAYRMSASEFYDEVCLAQREISEYIQNNNMRSAHVGAGEVLKKIKNKEK